MKSIVKTEAYCKIFRKEKQTLTTKSHPDENQLFFELEANVGCYLPSNPFLLHIERGLFSNVGSK